MKQKTYLLIVAIIFSIVAIVHLLRIIFEWTFIIENWAAPLWLSILPVILLGYLAYEGFRIIKKK